MNACPPSCAARPGGGEHGEQVLLVDQPHQHAHHDGEVEQHDHARRPAARTPRRSPRRCSRCAPRAASSCACRATARCRSSRRRAACGWRGRPGRRRCRRRGRRRSGGGRCRRSSRPRPAAPTPAPRQHRRCAAPAARRAAPARTTRRRTGSSSPKSGCIISSTATSPMQPGADRDHRQVADRARATTGSTRARSRRPA